MHRGRTSQTLLVPVKSHSSLLMKTSTVVLEGRNVWATHCGNPPENLIRRVPACWQRSGTPMHLSPTMMSATSFLSCSLGMAARTKGTAFKCEMVKRSQVPPSRIREFLGGGAFLCLTRRLGSGCRRWRANISPRHVSASCSQSCTLRPEGTDQMRRVPGG